MQKPIITREDLIIHLAETREGFDFTIRVLRQVAGNMKGDERDTLVKAADIVQAKIDAAMAETPPDIVEAIEAHLAKLHAEDGDEPS